MPEDKSAYYAEKSRIEANMDAVSSAIAVLEEKSPFRSCKKGNG